MPRMIVTITIPDIIGALVFGAFCLLALTTFLDNLKADRAAKKQ